MQNKGTERGSGIDAGCRGLGHPAVLYLVPPPLLASPTETVTRIIANLLPLLGF